MLRYSLGSLFLALLYLSIGCAALVNANGVWPQVAITMTLAILVLFSLGAIFWRERWRVFSIGFSATGWLYFLLVFSSVTTVRPYLLTESAVNWLFSTMQSEQPAGSRVVWETTTGPYGPARIQKLVFTAPLPPPSATVGNVPSGYYPATMPAAGTTLRPFVDPQSFANIGHSLWVVIVAFLGGVIAQLIHGKSRN